MNSHKNIYFYALLCISTRLLSEPYFKQFFIGDQQIAYAEGDTKTGRYLLHIQIQPEYASLITFTDEKEKQKFKTLLETIRDTRKNSLHQISGSDEEMEELLKNAFNLFCKQYKAAQIYSYRLSNGAQGHVFFMFTDPEHEPDDHEFVDTMLQVYLDKWSTPNAKRQTPSEQKTNDQTREDDDYWNGQKQYLTKEDEYCGEIPEELQRYVTMINNPEPYQKLGVYKSSGFVFYGPPGTGKTFLASIFAQKIKSDFMYIKGDELMNEYQASGMRKPAELFEKARKHRDKTKRPVTMFLDEIDTVVNTDGRHEATQQMIGALLKEIGSEINHDIFVVAATNKFSTLNSALLRSGRLQHHIKFELPDKYDRKKILEFLVKPYASSFSPDIKWEKIADITDRSSPADLKNMMEAVRAGLAIRIVKKLAKEAANNQTAEESRTKPLTETEAEPLIINQKDIEMVIATDLKKAKKSLPNQGHGRPWWGG